MRDFVRTDIGKIRAENQDNYHMPSDGMDLYIIADGMGGCNGGKAASTLAVKSVSKYLSDNFEKTQDLKEAILELIRNSIKYANTTVYEKSKTDIDLEGMGTTIDIVLIYNNRIYIGHIGDSRIYRIRKVKKSSGEEPYIIRKLTKDHTYVEKLIADGTITRAEAINHPKKNMLTKALGCVKYIEPDLMVKNFEKNDILIMCTDGLTNMVPDNQIYDIIIKNRNDLDKGISTLVKTANDAGGVDNITTIIIQNN